MGSPRTTPWVGSQKTMESKKCFGIGVGELQLPVLAGIGGVVDAGLVAGSGGHEEGFVGGEGDDAAEIEGGGVGHLGG